jgi:hypothetical protein
MAKIGFELFATNSEIIDFALETVRQNQLYFVYQDFKKNFITCSDVGNLEKESLLGITNIAIYDYEPSSYNGSLYDYYKLNPNGLLVRLGKETDEYLEESFVSSICSEPETLKMWKRIVSRYKRQLLKGAWVVNGFTGNKRYVKSRYYSFDAKMLYLKSVQMKVLNDHYLLEDETYTE